MNAWLLVIILSGATEIKTVPVRDEAACKELKQELLSQYHSDRNVPKMGCAPSVVAKPPVTTQY